MEFKNKVIVGDCLDVLKEIPDNYFDSVVTDAPYGLSQEPDIYEVLAKWLNGEDYKHRGGGFMGKTWDSFVPGPSVWKEVYRVLRPGGHLLCFAGTRTEDLMSIAIRMAGFERRDEIEWLYMSGFPKAMDVGKQFDKRKGFSMGGFDTRELGQFIKTYREKAGISRQDASEKVTGRRTGAFWNWENDYCIPEPELWPKIKKAINAPDSKWDEMFERAEREKIGEYKYSRKGEGTWDTEVQGGIFKAQERTVDITLPATKLAKKWDGWKAGTLKPAHEPVLMFRKPLEKNVCYNVEKWGTGALNIDGCSIPMGENEDTRRNSKGGEWREGSNTFKIRERHADDFPKRDGRFPANCITLEDDQFYSKYFNITPKELSKKASKKDRNSDWQGNQIDETNKHPTVKPVPLMEWLIKLVTQPGGIVLDPFCGSGSTLVAAKKNGFNYVGIDLNEEYVEIAQKRLGE